MKKIGLEWLAADFTTRQQITRCGLYLRIGGRNFQFRFLVFSIRCAIRVVEYYGYHGLCFERGRTDGRNFRFHMVEISIQGLRLSIVGRKGKVQAFQKNRKNSSLLPKPNLGRAQRISQGQSSFLTSKRTRETGLEVQQAHPFRSDPDSDHR